MKKQKLITPYLLPHDMIYDIMLKLPLKSLVRFKGLSKQWCTQITDPAFARRHFSNQGDASSAVVYIPDEWWRNRIFIVDTKELEKAKFGQSLRLPTIRLPIQRGAYVENCCDGILCVSIKYVGRILLWNPVTKWTKTINYNLESKDGFKALVGLGYDSSIQDYKLVRISSMYIEVMNLKSNAWRRVSSSVFPPSRYPRASPVYLNGILYWAIPFPLDFIISFDLTKEKLSIVRKPKEETKIYSCGQLTSFQGMLCFMRRCFETKSYEIWVMKEESNWERVFEATGYHHLLCGSRDRSDENPICRRSRITLMAGFDRSYRSMIWPKAYEYVGSMISPTS